MPLPTISFVVGLVVTVYLGTFVLFAILRIITGISIQRVGYSGFRRIAISPRPGIKIHIRGIGLSFHRPTFAQPTWISLNVTEPQITLDLRALGEAKRKRERRSTPFNSHSDRSPSDDKDKSNIWETLMGVKEKLKKLHGQIKWIKHFDLVVTRPQITIQEVGTIGIERFTMAVDTRANTVDRFRLFQRRKTSADTRTPAEWKSIVRSVLFTPEAKESIEILDYCTVNVHGFLHTRLKGLRDASISIKFGRMTVPYDELIIATDKAKIIHHESNPRPAKPPTIAINDVKMEDPASLDDKLVEGVSVSHEFIGSIIRGIQEFQLAVGFIGLSKRIQAFRSEGRPVHFNMAMKEVGLDVTRLDSRTPAHRMYFLPKDVAHQALLTAISISAGIDDGQKDPERMLYVPMITATVKTTVPSKTIHYAAESNSQDRNSNMLFANFVCTSPSLDLSPKHLPLLLAIARSRESPGRPKPKATLSPRGLVSRLLPRASIKMAVQEPVVRVALPPLGPTDTSDLDYDLLISSTSTMNLEIESQHSSEANSTYNLQVVYRQASHSFYYQSNSGMKHDLLQNETVEIALDASAFPETSVSINARFQSFSIFLIRPEISEGIRQIVKAIKKETPAATRPKDIKKPSFLRGIPAWLEHVNIKGSDFNVELAGMDTQISKYSRGFAYHLDSWSSEYKANRDEVYELAPRRRRSITRSISRNREDRSHTPTDDQAPRRKTAHPTDGRRLTMHLEGLEGLIIDSIPDSEADTFLTLPKFEVAFSTSTDAQGPLFHINAQAKSLRIQYSIYNYFALGIAVLTFRRMFLALGSHHVEEQLKEDDLSRTQTSESTPAKQGQILDEITTIDFKANFVQIKADMPADPPLMIQMFGIDAGRHRWATPFVRSKVVRLYCGTPGMMKVWSRIISLRNLRLDLRDIRHKRHDKIVVEEKSIDVTTDAIRLGVPHGLVLHSIFDNIANLVKTTEQLHHHFSTGSEEYILTKHPEGPKKVPRVSIRSQVLVFEIEDSPFEWKLGTIYRAGLIEQQQRIARAEAFRLKVKKMGNGSRRGSSRVRASSVQPSPSLRSRSTSRVGDANKQRSKSHGARKREESPEGHPKRGRKMRYNAEGACEFSFSGHISADKAYEKLQMFNANSWKKRIDRALYQQNHIIKDLRGILWGIDELPEEADQDEPIVGIPQRPALMSAVISDLGVVIDKPSFALQDLPKFLHDIGKGMPMDMKYGLLVPMNLKITMGEARFSLRDYPLPLLHIPATRSNQTPRVPSLQLTTDFVIAEEFQGIESQRHVNVVVCPDNKLGPDDIAKRFAIDVRRTVSPVKTYSDMKFVINSSAPTRITWSTSYQPAIQDMMQVIENFTKPPLDPSERVGFWDKIRLSFHSRVDVAWKGDGDVHFTLKGSRSPYVITGTGAGFVMVWRSNVRLQIAQDEDPRKFMIVDSGDYLLAIPDFNHYARSSFYEDDHRGSRPSSTSTGSTTAEFKKVVMKLSGNVRWMAGLMFERDVADGRTFKFCPHYHVVLKHPDFAKGSNYDAFRTFRSHHIHMSIAVAAPYDRDWDVSNLKPSKNYNSVHLTPRFFTHFWDWWSMFSGVMSLPVRQGPLWGNIEKSSKKFGRHLATIKYNLLFSPLYMSHIYKHKDAEDYASDVVSATGLKMKLDSFMLDLHQRRETFEIAGRGDSKPKKTSSMKINQCQLDFISADIRAVSATITGTSSKDIDDADEEGLANYQSPVTSKVDMSRFTIPDNDFTWIDMDDFVELDWILPAESNPDTKILPLCYGPRFSYFRQTDHGDHIAGDSARSSPFGDEPTHFCVMSKRNDPRRVQADLLESRIRSLDRQIEQNERAVGEQKLKVLNSNGHASMTEALETLKSHTETLNKRHVFLGDMLNDLIRCMKEEDPSLIHGENAGTGFGEDKVRPEDASDGVKEDPSYEHNSDFNNRFVVHNPQIKWNNSLRNIILRYIHQVSQRRGFVYYMSRRAVKFILDIVDERQKWKGGDVPDTEDGESYKSSYSPNEDDNEIQQRIAELLRDGKQFVDADDHDDNDDRRPSNATKNDDSNETNKPLSTEYLPQNSYHFRLIAPQVQLQSEKNPKSVALITAKGMQFKVVQIMDKDRIMDEVSGLVQRRFTADMDSLQVFITSAKTFSTEYLHMYSGNHYGGKASEFWPPWAPMEVMYEFSINPYGFNRVVHRTSASLRYDKFNNLRLKYHDDVSGGEKGKQNSPESAEARMDHIWIEFPHFRAICDSDQYYAMYVIATDLLLYSEPLEKTRSERLEKIMLASDFSDLSGAPEMVAMLQNRIRQLEDIKTYFQINEHMLDRQGWKDRIDIAQDLASCEDELFFIMKAITTSQQKMEDRNQEESSTGVLRWLISSKEIAWHLIRDKSESLVEFQLRNAQFARTDNNDGSNYNCVEIGRINGFNLLPNAVYPEIIAPYIDPGKGLVKRRDVEMLRVQWLQLEAIAGIQVVDYFEVNVMPLRVQLEREVAKKLFEYIFPGEGGSAFEGSPFTAKNTPKEEDEDEASINGDTSGLSITNDNPNGDDQGVGTGAGELEHRLQPTMKLPEKKKAVENRKSQDTLLSTAPSRWNLFNKSQSSVNRRGGSHAGSPATSERSLVRYDTTSSTDKKRPLTSSSSKKFKNGKEKEKDDEPSDDLTEMMNRASNYMTLAFFKIPSTVLCLSYKGRGSRNLEDVHDLVFRLPSFEYRNKTWSNLDLALQIKKDLIKALISHTGAIIGNKFSHHRPSRQQAQSRLKEIANMSTLLSLNENGEEKRGDNDDTDAWDDRPRPSFHSGRLNSSVRQSSYGSTTGSSTTALGQTLTGGSGADVASKSDSRLPLPSVNGNGVDDTENRPHTHAGNSNGHHRHRHHHHHDQQAPDPLLPPPPGLYSTDTDLYRIRSSSLGNKFTKMSQKIRSQVQVTTDNNNNDKNNGNSGNSGNNGNNAEKNAEKNAEDTDDSTGTTKRKSKILLGAGQKLLSRFGGDKGSES